MSGLGKRVERLERPDAANDKIEVWVRCPDDWPPERCRAYADAKAREQGHEPPVKVGNWEGFGPSPEAPRVLFLGTQTQAEEYRVLIREYVRSRAAYPGTYPGRRQKPRI